MNDPLDSAIPVGSGPGTTVPPAGNPPPAPAPTTTAKTISGNDKLWAILAHVSGLLGVPLILPLVIYLAMKGDSPYVADNAKEALNFHISLFLYTLGCGLIALTVIGIPVAAFICIAMAVASLVFSIVAAIKASEGGVYQYPLSLRLVK